MLQAKLTNNTAKTVTHVGVLVGPEEYEFPIRIEPHATTAILVGLPLPNDTPNYAPPILPVRQDVRGPVSDFSCWARAVDFADRSNYNVSPL